MLCVVTWDSKLHKVTLKKIQALVQLENEVQTFGKNSYTTDDEILDNIVHNLN